MKNGSEVVNGLYTGVSVSLVSIENMNYQFKPTLRIIWVLSGEVTLYVVGGENIMTADTIEVINIDEPVKMCSEVANKTLIIEFDRVLSKSVDIDIEYIVLNVNYNSFYKKNIVIEKEAHNNNIISLKKKVVSLLLFMSVEDKYAEKNINQSAVNLIDYLVKNFDDVVMKLKESPNINIKQIEHFSDMDKFLLRNISNKLSLKDLTPIKYLSLQYLSTEFQQKLNNSFSNIIEHYRISTALKHIINNDMSIGEVIKTSGYSCEKYFYKAFRKYFNSTPKIFRDENSKKTISFNILNYPEEFNRFLKLHDEYNDLVNKYDGILISKKNLPSKIVTSIVRESCKLYYLEGLKSYVFRGNCKTRILLIDGGVCCILK